MVLFALSFKFSCHPKGRNPHPRLPRSRLPWGPVKPWLLNGWEARALNLRVPGPPLGSEWGSVWRLCTRSFQGCDTCRESSERVPTWLPTASSPWTRPDLFSALALPGGGDVRQPGSCLGFWSRPSSVGRGACRGRGSGKGRVSGACRGWSFPLDPEQGSIMWTDQVSLIHPAMGGHCSCFRLLAAVTTCTQVCVWTDVSASPGEMDAQQRNRWVVQELCVSCFEQPLAVFKATTTLSIPLATGVHARPALSCLIPAIAVGRGGGAGSLQIGAAFPRCPMLWAPLHVLVDHLHTFLGEMPTQTLRSSLNCVTYLFRVMRILYRFWIQTPDQIKDLPTAPVLWAVDSFLGGTVGSREVLDSDEVWLTYFSSALLLWVLCLGKRF